ncbi:unnamed protein product [Rotaria sordida]|uniref:Uncharacterized protein n=1 Tax=Rotaria sordida TaxID=392033 RepID=A0A813TXG8_9BILA|nr:unnamed protein product [Rotaria sordida]
MFHHLLSASSTSTNTLRALRRLEQTSNCDSTSNFKTEYIKAAKKSSKLIRPISLPTNPLKTSNRKFSRILMIFISFRIIRKLIFPN